ncbi:class IV adenylate cyclase [Candidatus Saccharibacteria bacterium]|nr:class IV adenylate cyclase [Candidatus Saccharibacteria bacterium]
MKPEIEAKFLNADHDALRARLKELGAECVQPMRLMKRKNYDFSDGRLRKVGGWVRLRDEGGKITLSYKQLNDRTLHGTHEVSVAVSDFASADALLQAIGLKARTYQETKRESWRLDEFEIELDEWPWVKPFVEIEGPDEAGLKELAAKLGLDWRNVCHGSAEIVYRAEYDLTDEEFNGIPVVTFEEPVPDWLEQRRRP